MKKTFAAGAIMSTLVTSALLATGAAGAPTAGGLNSSFAGDGLVFGPRSTSGRGIAGTRDGKVVQARIPREVVRYSADGRLDRSFGSSGVAKTFFGRHKIKTTDVLVDRKGRVVVSGSCVDCGLGSFPWLTVGRLTASGKPDPSFGRGGLSLPRVGRYVQPKELAFAPGGKIVMTGSMNVGRNRKGGLVIRYLADGRLDRTFSGDGVLELTEKTGFVEVSSVAVEPSGGIVLGARHGRSLGDGQFGRKRPTVVRLRADGSFDRGFGDGGIASFKPPNASDGGVNDLTVDRQGRVVGVGHDRSVHAFVFRLRPGGELDGSFSADGATRIGYTTAKSVSVDSRGRILVLGRETLDEGNTSKGEIFRLKPNGSGDPRFRFHSPIKDIVDHFVDARGRIVASGSTYNGAAIARVLNP